MTTWTVQGRATGTAICSYDSPTAIEWVGFEFATHDHIAAAQAAPVLPVDGVITWTKLEYLRRFTQAERMAIRAAAKVSPQLEDYMALLELASEVRSNDPDIISALNMLEIAGLLANGRASEILFVPTSTPATAFGSNWPVTHRITQNGITQDAGISTDGIVRLPGGKWSTLEALSASGSTFVKV